jgi:hypothetical protein
MVVEGMGKSYYDEQNEKEKKDRSGKQRGVLWNFD